MTTPKVKIRKINKTKFYLTFWKDGKRIKRQTFNGTKQQAELIATKYQAEMLSGVFDFLEEKKIISLSQLFSEYLASKKPYVRSTTYRRYENYLTPFRNHLSNFFPEAANDISIIKTIYVNEIFSLLQKENEWENKTLNGARECIKSVFRLAIDEDYIEKIL